MTEQLLVGGHAFRELLGAIDVDKHLSLVKDEALSTNSPSKRDSAFKRIKYLAGLKKLGMAPDKAYTVQNIPVLPPVFRPVMVSGQKLEFADVNQLYKDHMLASAKLGEIKDLLMDSELIAERGDLYKGAKALFGYGDPISGASRGRDLKGMAVQIAGDGSPKLGYFQNKLMSKKQDFSGRGVIAADPTLGFNEASMPKSQLWTMYKFHIVRDLVKKGYSYLEAERAYEEKKPAAEDSFRQLVKTIPIILNRAPTLMRSNISAFFPVAKEDSKTIGLNPLHLPLFAGDYDGDALSSFVPITHEAIEEAKKKMLPMHQMYDYRAGIGASMVAPGHEAILGSVHMTEPDHSQKTVHFKTEKDALLALKAGTITENTPITIGN